MLEAYDRFEAELKAAGEELFARHIGAFLEGLSG